MKKFVPIIGIVFVLLLLISAPGVFLSVVGLVGIPVSIGRFIYFKLKKRPAKAQRSAIIGGAAVIALIAGALLTPAASTKNETKTEQLPKTEQLQTTKKNTVSSSQPKELSLKIAESIESDDKGTLTIKGKTEPHALVYIASETSDKKQTADASGNFELPYTLSTDSEEELRIVSELDKQTSVQRVLVKPSPAFISAKAAEVEKKAEEVRLAKEQEKKQAAEKQKQEEITRLTQEAENAVKNAEANQTRENHAQATTAIAAIPEGNQGLANRLAAVDSAIHAREEQEAQQAQAAAAAQEAEAQQAAAAQNEAGQTILITPTGSKYHNRKCGNGTYNPSTLQYAESIGLTACSKCFG